MQENNIYPGAENLVTRHSKKFKPEKSIKEKIVRRLTQRENLEVKHYPGLTRAGVELGHKTTAEKLKPMIDNLPPDAIFALIGASDQIRTKSTSQVYGNTLAKLYQDDDNVIVKTKEQVEDYNHAVKELTNEIKQSPDKKFVINFPLFIKQFSMAGKWMDNKGHLVPYADKLSEISENNDNEAVINWVKTNGKINDIEGPKPLEIAQNYEEGFRRLREFCEKQIPDRSIMVGG